VAELSLDMILKATKGRLAGGSAPSLLQGVSTDSRNLPRGALFVALRGERYDGHAFVDEAFDRAAGAALVSRRLAAPGPLILVKDTLEALGALAAAHRDSLSVRVIAITGSTGKTTTKEMLASILARGWHTGRTPGNYNNEIGVPLALLELDASYRWAVVEMAMRGVGQIAYLSRMAQPHIGVVTNIGVSHLELLGSRESIAKTKAELLLSLPPDGAAVLNADDEFFGFLKQQSTARVISFSQHGDADVRVEGIRVEADGRVSLELHGWWGKQEISLRMAGRHQALNAAAAATAAMAAGAEPDWVASGLSEFEGAEMRGRIARAPTGYTVIDDCYNAAPESMRVALELLGDLPGERKWAVLGDMKELGPMGADWHREMGNFAAELKIDKIVTVGDLGRYIAEGARSQMSPSGVVEAPDNESAAAAVAEAIQPGDVVLVKGSRAMQMEEIVRRLLGQPAPEQSGETGDE